MTNLRFMYAVAGLALASVATAAPAFAWGAEGHRLTADIAYRHLTPSAKAAVDALIAKDAPHQVEKCPVNSLADASVWPDCVRGMPGVDWMRPLHYNDIPLFGPADKAAYCPNSQCATEAIKAALAVLKNKAAPATDRALALYQIAHFIGDIHQPLHAADNGDKGGNDLKVIYLGEAENYNPFKKAMDKYNLHFVWDTMLPANAFKNRGRDEIAALAKAHTAEWAKGDADAWVSEAHDIAVKFTYGRLPVKLKPGNPPPEAVAVDQDYVDASAPIVREQLAKAAVRLAYVLNRALAD